MTTKEILLEQFTACYDDNGWFVALGYVCKDVSEAELVKAIHVVNSGGKYIPQQIADILTENFGQ
nr:response regulator transcription factor [Acidobacteriota bacterium]